MGKSLLAALLSEQFRGRFHVLGGAICPIVGVGPDVLRV